MKTRISIKVAVSRCEYALPKTSGPSFTNEQRIWESENSCFCSETLFIIHSQTSKNMWWLQKEMFLTRNWKEHFRKFYYYWQSIKITHNLSWLLRQARFPTLYNRSCWYVSHKDQIIFISNITNCTTFGNILFSIGKHQDQAIFKLFTTKFCNITSMEKLKQQ